MECSGCWTIRGRCSASALSSSRSSRRRPVGCWGICARAARRGLVAGGGCAGWASTRLPGGIRTLSPRRTRAGMSGGVRAAAGWRPPAPFTTTVRPARKTRRASGLPPAADAATNAGTPTIGSERSWATTCPRRTATGSRRGAGSRSAMSSRSAMTATTGTSPIFNGTTLPPPILTTAAGAAVTGTTSTIDRPKRCWSKARAAEGHTEAVVRIAHIVRRLVARQNLNRQGSSFLPVDRGGLTWLKLVPRGGLPGPQRSVVRGARFAARLHQETSG